MQTIFSILKMGARAALWRSTPHPPALTARSVVGWAVVCAIASIALQYWSAVSLRSFAMYGVNAIIAWLAVWIALLGLLLPAAQRSTAIAASLLTAIYFGIAVSVVSAVFGIDINAWTKEPLGYMFYVLSTSIWSVGSALAILRSVAPDSSFFGHLGRAFAMVAATFIASNLFPHYPAFRPKNFEIATANTWEAIRAEGRKAAQGNEPPPREVNRASSELAQGWLMDAAISNLAPQRPGHVDVYAIGLAGWSDQDVFIKEVDGALASVGRSLDITGRTIKLVNHPDTVLAIPAASRQNLAAAVRAIAKVMDRDEDVLMLFLTSHGDQDGIALQLNGAFYTDLSPDAVAQVLQQEGIRHRIVIVSACYAGVYLRPLASDDSIVITAADDKSSSFGCSNEREWTYFGDAFFNQSLQPHLSLQQTFDGATRLISEWERRDQLKPSNPQGHFGAALMQRLAPLHATREAATLSILKP